MLGKGGAYSKQYQMEDRERMREWQSVSTRNTRDREHTLSKQTAQRRKALEQKKRAMAQAEEDRRRKALEERRQAQREATERCKMAISRLKISSRPTNHRNKDIPVETHYSNFPRQVEDGSSTGKKAGNDGGRIVLGSQVELRDGNITNDKKRPPSLDEVLKSIRGYQASPKPHESLRTHSPPAPQTATPRPASVQERSEPGAGTVIRVQSSTSESNISTQFPVYKVHEIDGGQESSSRQPPTKSIGEEIMPDTDGMVFHPVTRGPLKTRYEVSREAHRLRVTSPSQGSTSSSGDGDGGSPLDSLSCDSSDDTMNRKSTSNSLTFASSSCDSGVKDGRRVVRRHKKIVKEKNDEKSKNDSQDLSTQNVDGSTVQSLKSSTCTYFDSSTDDETTQQTPPRTRRRRKLPPGDPSGGSKQKNIEPQPSDEHLGPKIVGILKKPRGGSFTDGELKEEGFGKVENAFKVCSATASCGNSATSSVLTLERNRTGDGDRFGTSAIVIESQISRDTVQSATTKRVRFSDNLESSLDSSQSSVTHHHTPTTPHPHRSHTSTIDNSIEQLWKRVLPNGVHNDPRYQQHYHLPNEMFNPRMKISLSQRSGGQVKSKTVQRPPTKSTDRITVHIPQAKDQKLVEEDQNSINTNHDDQSCSRKVISTIEGVKKDEEKFDVKNRVCGREDQTTNQYYAKEITESIDTGAVERCKNPNKDAFCNGVDEGPTDAEIDQAWDDIQMQLYGRNERVTVAPQVFKFQPDPQRGSVSTHRIDRGAPALYPTQHRNHVAGEGERERGREGGRHLPHRPQQRPTKSHGGMQSHTHKQHQQHTTNTYHQSDKNIQASSWKPLNTRNKPVVTDLSHEEQRLMQSIEKINQKLKDHVVLHEGPLPSHIHRSQPLYHSGNNRWNN